jgi:hypothetical protein
MMNFKQQELGHRLFDQLKQKFPEIELIEIAESPRSRDSLRVRVNLPADEERQMALGDLAAEISTDILLEYGYHILLSFARRSETLVA